MPSIRYYVSRIATKTEPMALNALCSEGYLTVEDQGNSEATDRTAYLLATSQPGQLTEIVHVGEQRVVWRQGMAIPGEIITVDMVGMTFAEAIKLSARN